MIEIDWLVVLFAFWDDEDDDGGGGGDCDDA
jgi:hypothetical protein